MSVKMVWNGEAVGEALGEQVAAALATFALELKARAQAYTPVDTGRMQAGWDVAPGNGLSIVISNEVVDPESGFPYPIVIEYGGAGRAPVAPMRRAINELSPRFAGLAANASMGEGGGGGGGGAATSGKLDGFVARVKARFREIFRFR